MAKKDFSNIVNPALQFMSQTEDEQEVIESKKNENKGKRRGRFSEVGEKKQQFSTAFYPTFKQFLHEGHFNVAPGKITLNQFIENSITQAILGKDLYNHRGEMDLEVWKEIENYK